MHPAAAIAPAEKVNDVVVSQVNRGKDQAADNGEEDIEKEPLVPMGQIRDNEDDLSMAAGHAIPFIMLQGIEDVPDEIGNETCLQRDRIKMGHRVSRSDRREENVFIRQTKRNNQGPRRKWIDQIPASDPSDRGHRQE